MAGKEKIIELMARCLEDLLCWRYLAHSARSKLCIQDYINVYLIRRVTDSVQQKIYRDQVLNTLISQDPRENPESLQITAWDERPYLLSTQFRDIGDKYITSWQKMRSYLLGGDTEWWLHLSEKWMQQVGQQVFNSKTHTQRQRDREKWAHMQPHLSLNEDIQHLILTYLWYSGTFFCLPIWYIENDHHS